MILAVCPLLDVSMRRNKHTRTHAHTYTINCVITKLEYVMCRRLHSPSKIAVKAKIYIVLYNQSSSIAFNETSSY